MNGWCVGSIHQLIYLSATSAYGPITDHPVSLNTEREELGTLLAHLRGRDGPAGSLLTIIFLALSTLGG